MQAKFPLLSLITLLLVITGCCNTSREESSSGNNTNKVMENILKRTSIREYSDKEISHESIENLLKAGMAAPSSRDRRPWHFVVISDKTILQNLGENLKTASCLTGANKAIIVCGDTDVSDNCWFLDCSAATQNILLAATSMDIGAVWAAAYPYDDRESIIREILQLPENIRPLSVIPLGYPAMEGTPKDKFDTARIHIDKW